MSEIRASRRIVFQGLGALGVAAALAGCGGGSEPSTTVAAEPGTPLATTAEVPVGGGIVLPDAQLVITQPTAGTFLGFNITCTHTGTPVNQVDGTEIVCPNHGSRFSIEDGSALVGPASSPLASVELAVEGENIVLA
jgi:nitrite reductase/ring-hydroxylating ferredoxin subunit